MRKFPMSIADNEYPDQLAYLCRVDQKNDCLPVYSRCPILWKMSYEHS